ADHTAHAPAPQPLDARRRLALGEARRALKEGELELPADDRRHPHQLLTGGAEPVEAPGDQLSTARRQGEPGGFVWPGSLLQRTEHLDRHERIALADRPDVRRLGRRVGLVATPPRQREPERRGRRERTTRLRPRAATA